MGLERSELSVFDEKRVRVTGTITEFGLRKTPLGMIYTFLLCDVKVLGEVEVAIEHTWVTSNKYVNIKNLAIGCEVKFSARVRKYAKGRGNRTERAKKGDFDAYGFGRMRSLTVARKGDGIHIKEFQKGVLQKLSKHSIVS